MNEDKSETTGQRTDDPMLDHACTMRIALAIARRQNELDLRLHRIEQALKLGGHANFPSTDRNQPTTQKNKERTDNGRNTVDHDRIHVRARREEHHRGPFQSQRDHLLAQDQHRRKLDPHPIHDPEHPVRPDPARRGHEDHPIRTLALVFHKLAALAAGLALILALIVWFWYDHSKPDFAPCFWGSIGVIVASILIRAFAEWILERPTRAERRAMKRAAAQETGRVTMRMPVSEEVAAAFESTRDGRRASL